MSDHAVIRRHFDETVVSAVTVRVANEVGLSNGTRTLQVETETIRDITSSILLKAFRRLIAFLSFFIGRVQTRQRNASLDFLHDPSFQAFLFRSIG